MCPDTTPVDPSLTRAPKLTLYYTTLTLYTNPTLYTDPNRLHYTTLHYDYPLTLTILTGQYKTVTPTLHPKLVGLHTTNVTPVHLLSD